MTRRPKNDAPRGASPATQPMPNGPMPYQPGPGLGSVNLARVQSPPRSAPPPVQKVNASAPPKLSVSKPQKERK